MSIGNNRGRTLAMAGLVAGVLAASNVVCAQIPCGGYEVTAIIQAPECPPFGFPPTIGTAISEPIDGGLPNVVGYYQSCTIGPDTAFLWIGNEDQFITLPMPPGTISSRAYDIAGTQIVGAFDLSGDGLGGLAFVYDYETDEFINLGTFPPGNFSIARSIKTNMQVTGYWGNFVNGDPAREAFIWENGRMTSLAPDLGTPGSEAHDLNCTGQVTGWMGIAPHIKSNAFVWHQGEVTVLPFIPGGFSSAGDAINSRGDVAGLGWMFDKDANEDVRRAFAWIDGEMIRLGTLPGYPESSAKGINDDRTVVGHAFTNTSRAFVWKDGVLMALNDLISPDVGLNIKVALAINQTGQIIAFGTDPNSVSWILTPIEPPVGDLDGDCHVGVSDLLMLLGDWGPCKNCDDCRADLDGDCSVGVKDLLILLGNWG
ncbi:MAG: hypothetical protein IIA64_09830 [Planctomycetes bacterium]|nr:hypothetical protein [Planctomycetota bacterium]